MTLSLIGASAPSFRPVRSVSPPAFVRYPSSDELPPSSPAPRLINGPAEFDVIRDRAQVHIFGRLLRNSFGAAPGNPATNCPGSLRIAAAHTHCWLPPHVDWQDRLQLSRRRPAVPSTLKLIKAFAGRARRDDEKVEDIDDARPGGRPKSSSPVALAGDPRALASLGISFAAALEGPSGAAPTGRRRKSVSWSTPGGPIGCIPASPAGGGRQGPRDREASRWPPGPSPGGLPVGIRALLSRVPPDLAGSWRRGSPGGTRLEGHAAIAPDPKAASIGRRHPRVPLSLPTQTCPGWSANGSAPGTYPRRRPRVYGRRQAAGHPLGRRHTRVPSPPRRRPAPVGRPTAAARELHRRRPHASRRRVAASAPRRGYNDAFHLRTTLPAPPGLARVRDVRRPAETST